VEGPPDAPAIFLLHGLGATGATNFESAFEPLGGRFRVVVPMQGGRVVAPPVLTGLILGLGAPGWAVVAVIFVAAGLALPAIVAWARRNRPTGVTREDELATSGSI
jgi:predicted esterase